MDDLIIYNTEDGNANVSLLAKDGTVWCTQAQMSELFSRQQPTISKHIADILKDGELDEKSNIQKMNIANSDKPITLYSLNVILAVGFRVRSKRGTQFRKWANTALKEYLQKGYLINVDRMKNPDGRPDYFDELLEKIRDIRASEKRFYQKLRDLFALSSDYDKASAAAHAFYAETQNKLIYGITGCTAAELIVRRADPEKYNMGLTSWQGSIVRRTDIYTAKNYLTEDEIDSLTRLVSIFLESAEFRVKARKDLTLRYWQSVTDTILRDHDVPVLHSAGKVSREKMKETADARYELFEERRKRADAIAADVQDLEELEAEAKAISNEKRE